MSSGEGVPQDLTDDGRVVGFVGISAGHAMPLFWTVEHVWTKLLTADKVGGCAYGINNQGVIVGVTASEASPHEGKATVWLDGQPAILTSVGAVSEARAINEDGVIVGYTASNVGNLYEGTVVRIKSENTTAAMWIDGKHTSLPVKSFTSSVSLSVNTRGVIVGYAHRSEAIGGEALVEAVVWKPHERSYVASALPRIGGDSAWAYHITDGGTVAGAARDTSHVLRPVVWRDSKPAILPLPTNLKEGQAFGANDKGWVIGNGWEGKERHALLWINGQVYLLDDVIDVDVILRDAVAVNDAGVILVRGSPGGVHLLVPVEKAE